MDRCFIDFIHFLKTKRKKKENKKEMMTTVTNVCCSIIENLYKCTRVQIFIFSFNKLTLFNMRHTMNLINVYT